jgi:hypothetical protein
LKEKAALTEEELVNRCCRLLGGVKKPRSIGFVTELPKRPNAKITKRPLRLIFSAPHGSVYFQLRPLDFTTAATPSPGDEKVEDDRHDGHQGGGFVQVQAQEQKGKKSENETCRPKEEGRHQSHMQTRDAKNVFLKYGQRSAFEALAFITSHAKPAPQVWLFHSY